MSKHTPGPWYRINGSDIFTEVGAPNASGIKAPRNDGWMVADCDMGSLGFDEVTANARLIAAAPDLLTALEMVLDDPESLDGRPRTYSAARAAIAKARGDK